MYRLRRIRGPVAFVAGLGFVLWALPVSNATYSASQAGTASVTIVIPERPEAAIPAPSPEATAIQPVADAPTTTERTEQLVETPDVKISKPTEQPVKAETPPALPAETPAPQVIPDAPESTATPSTPSDVTTEVPASVPEELPEAQESEPTTPSANEALSEPEEEGAPSEEAH